MILARVIGEVWGTRKHARLRGRKLLLVQPYFSYNLSPAGQHLVAVDELGAGLGDDVVACLGSPAREALGDPNLPVDATLMAIVDRCQLERSAFASTARRPLCFATTQPPRDLEWT